MNYTRGHISVVESGGPYPVLYLIGPADAPFTDLPNSGPVLATVYPTNPNAARDAHVWAKAGRMKELLEALVNSIISGNRAEKDRLYNEAVELLKELGKY